MAAPDNSGPGKTGSERFAFRVALACALISLFCFLAPMYVIRPFRSAGPREFPFAMAVRNAGPLVSLLCVLLDVAVVLRAWPHARVSRTRRGLILCLVLTLLGACLTRINVFEIMFHPYLSPAFAAADSVALDKDDMVMSVTVGGEIHAYPIRAIGYHHIVNDVVGGIPVVATYCTLCHTGIVWKRVLDGRTLTFRLTGIRDDNALLRDEETNSIWQQTTGAAIFGPRKGKQLELMHSDELSFAVWRAEEPRGFILKPNVESASLYEAKDWEKTVEDDPAAIDTSKTGIQPHELMLGIVIGSANKAFPWEAVLSAGLIQDHVGADPVLLVVGPDNLSIRAFRTSAHTTFLRQDAVANELMRDAETSSSWNFSGCAIGGPLTGQCLKPLDVVKDYWFDWRNHHPSTQIFGR